MDSYRLVHVNKNAVMWNSVMKAHMRKHPTCTGFLSRDPAGEEQRGLVWRERAKCDTCKYVSRRFTLYDEVEDNTRDLSA